MAGIDKEITFQKNVKCDSCKGSKEAVGSQSSVCYSCKGVGLKKDPLFQKETICNTCKGHGHLVKNPCKVCNGTGKRKILTKKIIKIPKYTENQKVYEYEEEGH